MAILSEEQVDALRRRFDVPVKPGVVRTPTQRAEKQEKARKVRETKSLADLDVKMSRYESWVHQLSKANVSLAWYETQMAEQHGLCAICGKPETLMRNGQVRRLAADHNHCTGEKRGLLCMVCNTRLAWLENVEWRTRAEAYLVIHESAVLT